MQNIKNTISDIQNLLNNISSQCQLDEKTLKEISRITDIIEEYKKISANVKFVQPEDIFKLDRENKLWESVLIVSQLGELKI